MLFDRGRGKRLSVHRKAARDMARVPFDDEAAMSDLRRRLKTVGEDSVISLIVLLVEQAAAYGGYFWDGAKFLSELTRRPLPWTATDVSLLFQLGRSASRWTDVVVIKAAVTAAERLDPVDRPGCVDEFREALRRVGSRGDEPTDRARLASRLRALIESTDPSARATVRTAVIRIGDGWSHPAVDRLRAVSEDVDAVSDVLANAATIPAGPRPTKAWLKRAGEMTSGRPEVLAVVHDLLEIAHTCEPGPGPFLFHGRGQRVDTANADLLRGLLWTALASGAAWVPGMVAALQATPVEPRVLNTCFAVLGRRGDAESIAALTRMQRATQDRGELTQIAKALDEAAANAGVSRSELTEQTISDAGLDDNRERRVTSGTVTAVLRLDGHAKVSLVWEHGGATVAKPPAAADPSLVAQLKRDAAELKKLVAGERDRLEDLIVEDREWALPVWRQRYGDHPVTGSLANRLLWTLIDGASPATALPGNDGRFTLVDGSTVEPSDQARIRVWHPVTADPEQIHAWRTYILNHELAQPFKQAFREVYLLTPAEEETRLYSNRFAAHVLRYQQTYALMKQRRWGTNYLGGWDGGYNGEAKRDFPSHGLRAVFFHEPSVDQDGDRVEHCITDQVQFQRRNGREWEPVPLADIPAAVFSEAMRDVDLFVGVTSLATDPTWYDRGTERHFAYWRGVAFGDLSAHGRVRRQVIEHLLPRLKIRDRARIEGNYLVVDGRKHTYRIHIGSGNILMSPNDRYLCIVAARGAKPTGSRFLPFEGDEMLTLVLSKALMLADDDRITDRSIRRQIG